MKQRRKNILRKRTKKGFVLSIRVCWRNKKYHRLPITVLYIPKKIRGGGRKKLPAGEYTMYKYFTTYIFYTSK